MAFDDLYQEIILDHYRHPRNSADLSGISDENLHENPSCGDSLKLDLKVAKDGTIEEVLFDGKGCAISVASASMMTELLKGMKIDKARMLAEQFMRTMRGEDDIGNLEQWGEVAALGGVVSFPLRVKCATLAWHAFHSAAGKLEEGDE